jgi:hypothetical protein
MLKENAGPPLSAFSDELAVTLEEKSIFSQKMICCCLTRDKKYTVAGNRLKITGPPRFASMPMHDGDSSPVVPVVTREIKSEHEL